MDILQAAFACADPKSVKKTVNLTVFFVLSGSLNIKATCRMLMKLTPEENPTTLFFACTRIIFYGFCVIMAIL